MKIISYYISNFTYANKHHKHDDTLLHLVVCSQYFDNMAYIIIEYVVVVGLFLGLRNQHMAKAMMHAVLLDSLCMFATHKIHAFTHAVSIVFLSSSNGT